MYTNEVKILAYTALYREWRPKTVKDLVGQEHITTTLKNQIENDRIVDIKYDGEACAICTSSTSIMTETLIGKTLEEAREIVNNFDNMINEKEYNKDILESAIVYDDIYRQPNRKKCALLSWWGIEKIINKGE